MKRAPRSDLLALGQPRVTAANWLFDAWFMPAKEQLVEQQRAALAQTAAGQREQYERYFDEQKSVNAHLRGQLESAEAELKFLRRELAKYRSLLKRIYVAAAPEGFGVNDDWLRAQILRHNRLASLRERSHRKAVRK